MIYPCASVLSVFHFRPVDIAEGWWTLLLTDIFIPCFSQIYSFRVVVVSPAFGVDTNQKKKHGYHGLDTDWSFTDLFFDIIWLMILGFGYGFIWICECWHTPFPGILYTDFITKTRINSCMLLRALRLDSCHTGRPYESELSTVNLHDRNRWRPQSPPRKSIQAINQDKPAAQWSSNYGCAVKQFRTQDSCNQPPPSLPRRGGTVTIAIDKRLIIR